MKFYLEVSFSENHFCCLLQNCHQVIIDTKWEGLSEFITSTGAAELVVNTSMLAGHGPDSNPFVYKYSLCQ